MAPYYDPEKTPVGPHEFGGLEVDQRSPSERSSWNDKPLPAEPAEAYMNRTTHCAQVLGSSIDSSPRAVAYTSSEYDPTTEKLPVNVANRSAGSAQKRRTRRNKWKIVVSIVILLAIVAIAAVVGGIVGSRHEAGAPKDGSTAPPIPTITSPTASPEQINAQLPSHDVMVGSPIVPITFEAGPEDSYASQGRNTQLFYQNAQGDPFLLKEQPTGDWGRLPDALFTDTINNTGLAAINYLNGTTRQSSIFYVSVEGTIREKRLYPDQSTQTWELGTIQKQHWTTSGKTGFDDAGNPVAGWAGFNMAAVYSTNFSSGAGARLFYHKHNSTASWIQEAIWVQANDSWSEGSQIHDALPSSHLSAVIDRPTQALRLFYASSNNTLSESWYSISNSTPTWVPGSSISNVLIGASYDFAAIATTTDTILFYTSTGSAESNITINELVLPEPLGKVASISSARRVVTPALMAGNTDSGLHSLYAPLGAIYSTAGDDEEALITVFWTEEVEDRQSGYGSVCSLSRAVNSGWDKTKVQSLPIGSGR